MLLSVLLIGETRETYVNCSFYGGAGSKVSKVLCPRGWGGLGRRMNMMNMMCVSFMENFKTFVK